MWGAGNPLFVIQEGCPVVYFVSNILPIPAPMLKPSAIHRPTLLVTLPISTPTTNPKPAPIDV